MKIIIAKTENDLCPFCNSKTKYLIAKNGLLEEECAECSGLEINAFQDSKLYEHLSKKYHVSIEEIKLCVMLSKEECEGFED
ncbi:MAG: hypothetical protein DRN49_01625 [Thaumarchaeota archaeon]|nr:MAG: hypothetical protein DRN49_01625 [Nitrososphaerota archaeon]